MSNHDAIVVGAGPNGLAAAITLARAGLHVLVREAADEVGGGSRTAELTLPGYRHDVCSAVHPLGVASPFFRQLPLAGHGLEWVHAPVLAAHPLDDGTAATLEPSLDATADGLGPDGRAYRRLFAPFVRRADDLFDDVLRPLRLPSHPLLMARFGVHALRSARGLARSRFARERGRALFAGLGAHANLPLDFAATAAYGLALVVAAHVGGWPVPRGGAGSLTDALAGYFEQLGGVVQTDSHVESLDQLPPARLTLLDLTPKQVLRIAGHRLPVWYAAVLKRYRYGPAAFKVDWALSEPVPWTADACRRAMVVHVGGTLDEVSRSEREPWGGRIPERPFVLFAQPSLFDDARAPEGRHTGWGYCHVPNGCDADMLERIEAQIERFAPGFRDTIVARSVRGPADLERANPNLVGGDISGGAGMLRQLVARPAPRWNPYATGVRGLYICSAATPPGGGVHGMCGYHAARAALAEVS